MISKQNSWGPVPVCPMGPLIGCGKAWVSTGETLSSTAGYKTSSTWASCGWYLDSSHSIVSWFFFCDTNSWIGQRECTLCYRMHCAALSFIFIKSYWTNLQDVTQKQMWPKLENLLSDMFSIFVPKEFTGNPFKSSPSLAILTNPNGFLLVGENVFYNLINRLTVRFL